MSDEDRMRPSAWLNTILALVLGIVTFQALSWFARRDREAAVAAERAKVPQSVFTIPANDGSPAVTLDRAHPQGPVLTIDLSKLSATTEVVWQLNGKETRELIRIYYPKEDR